MAPRGPWALTLRSLAKLSPEEREPQHCLIVAGNEILEKLAKRDTQDVFAEPVDTSVVTDYLTVVKKPMDLGTVREKLNRGQYTCVEDLREDIDLIWDNCCLYNAPETEFYALAVKLREVTVKLFQQLEIAFQEIGMEPPRRKNVIQKGGESSKNLKQENSEDPRNEEDRSRLSEPRVPQDETQKTNAVGQQESLEQPKPLVLHGPKRKRSVPQEDLTTTQVETTTKQSKSLADFKLIKYTHFYPLLQSILSDRSENILPYEESARVVAESVLQGLESFFQASAPTARLLLSQWLNNDQSKATVSFPSTQNSDNLEKKRLARLVLQQAGFHLSEVPQDIETDEGNSIVTPAEQVSPLLWNAYRSQLLEQGKQDKDDLKSNANSIQKLEQLVSQQVVHCSPQSFVLGVKKDASKVE
ncbi:hypothetical protein GAYE_SCF67G6880 [Galdieria yellowstonensis]|uniref:Bromo domain-containing protein n=1 Tax=Galdieria yellowstonensis TaxID=3028027 RepID=A0AAV9IP42_9RHOD|nr:hypothetical protein GAYE_SCF67G6880 [Galdieria yellowstonensis]